jgi:carbonic anhydrase/acetyltransferase-like protein (isoleucine patch superfamily)
MLRSNHGTAAEVHPTACVDESAEIIVDAQIGGNAECCAGCRRDDMARI